MAILIQATCLILLLGMVFSWPFPITSEQRPPLTFIHTSFEEGSSSSSSLFDEINRMMAAMHQRFENMVGWPSFPTAMYDDNDDELSTDEDKLNLSENLMTNEQKLHVIDDLTDIRKKLDDVEPICTTITDSTTTISPRKSRRKKVRGTQITTCIRELNINGQKHISEEISTTDDKGVLIKYSKSYSTISAGIDQNKQ